MLPERQQGEVGPRYTPTKLRDSVSEVRLRQQRSAWLSFVVDDKSAYLKCALFVRLRGVASVRARFFAIRCFRSHGHSTC